MKNFLNQKTWLFSLSLAFIGSSLSTSLSAQDVIDLQKESKVTIIRINSDENVETLTQKAPKESTSNSYRYQWNDKGADTYLSNKPQLGVFLDDKQEGAVVSKIVSNSAAETVGLLVGDKITSINDKEINKISDLQNIIASHVPGNVIQLEYNRNGAIFTKKVTLKAAEKPHYTTRTESYSNNYYERSSQQFSNNPCEKLTELRGKPFLGVYLNHSHQENGTGAGITSIISKTGAEKAALQADDKIIKMNFTAINSTKEAIAFIESKKPGDLVRIQLIRGDQKMTLNATLGSWTEAPQYASKVTALETECDLKTPAEPINTEETTRLESSPSSKTNMMMETSMSLEVFPNPTTDVVTIKFEGQKAPLHIRVLSLDGKEMYTQTINNFGGTYNEQLSLSKYPAGIYLVHLKQNDHQVSQQVVVQ